jgi:solute carrier family 9 (sodium/hydrogen exchanger), member 6/7
MNVDVNLYALIFGESVFNDAVAIVLSGSIQNYGEHYSNTGGFESEAFFRALSDFFSVFFFSLCIGAAMGCVTALMTKYTRIRDFPLLESALFVLMSYSTFLIAEASQLTGQFHAKLNCFGWKIKVFLFQELLLFCFVEYAKLIIHIIIYQKIRV